MASATEANAQNSNQAVMALVGRSAKVVIQEGKFRGQRGVVVAGQGPSFGAAAVLCVRVANQPGNVRLPLTAVREPLVSRFVHKLEQLILAPRR